MKLNRVASLCVYNVVHVNCTLSEGRCEGKKKCMHTVHDKIHVHVHTNSTTFMYITHVVYMYIK